MRQPVLLAYTRFLSKHKAAYNYTRYNAFFSRPIEISVAIIYLYKIFLKMNNMLDRIEKVMSIFTHIKNMLIVICCIVFLIFVWKVWRWMDEQSERIPDLQQISERIHMTRDRVGNMVTLPDREAFSNKVNEVRELTISTPLNNINDHIDAVEGVYTDTKAQAVDLGSSYLQRIPFFNNNEDKVESFVDKNATPEKKEEQ